MKDSRSWSGQDGRLCGILTTNGNLYHYDVHVVNDTEDGVYHEVVSQQTTGRVRQEAIPRTAETHIFDEPILSPVVCRFVAELVITSVVPSAVTLDSTLTERTYVYYFPVNVVLFL